MIKEEGCLNGASSLFIFSGREGSPVMKYYSKPPAISRQQFGETYKCDHPVYDICTLYRTGERGLAVIQQRFEKDGKRTYWTNIDPWLANALYLLPKFHRLLDDRAKEPVDGLYPTMSVRQVMWAVRMKPLRRERWETVFDRKDI